MKTFVGTHADILTKQNFYKICNKRTSKFLRLIISLSIVLTKKCVEIYIPGENEPFCSIFVASTWIKYRVR